MQSEHKIRVGVVSALSNDKNEILLMLRNNEPAKGQWAVVGGKLEPYEKLQDCIVREIKEELDVDVAVTKFLGNIEDIDKDKNLHWIMPCFITQIVSGEVKNVEPEKHAQIGWYSLEQAKTMNISFMTKQVLKLL